MDFKEKAEQIVQDYFGSSQRVDRPGLITRIEHALQEASASAWDESRESIIRYLSDIGIQNVEILREAENPYKQVEKES